MGGKHCSHHSPSQTQRWRPDVIPNPLERLHSICFTAKSLKQTYQKLFQSSQHEKYPILEPKSSGKTS